MGISKYFLDKFDISKTAFTKFVRAKTNLLNNTISKKLNQIDGDDEWWPADDEHVASAETCCGVCEIGSVGGDQRDIDAAVALGISRGYRFLIYYSNNRAVTKRFQKLGFEVTATFKNRNTGNTIDVCQLDLTEE